MAEKVLPVGVERVRVQFEEWRGRKKGRERIPERLWEAAAAAARRHGVNAVSRALRVEHSRLRQRVEKAGSDARDSSTFLELEREQGTGTGCIVELEKGNGTRMRICVSDGATVDWSRMKEAFLGG